MVQEEPTLTLLVDGGSVLYSSMADDRVNTSGVHYGGVFNFLIQIKTMLAKRSFDRIVVFFDNSFSGALRYYFYAPYKQQRGKHYEDYGVSEYMKKFNENLRRMQNKIFKHRKKNGEEKEEKKSDWDLFVDENFARERDILCTLFNEMCVRWAMDDVCEGDDLIAYYCLNKRPNERIVIVSSDLDYAQLLSDEVIIYNQIKKITLSKANFKKYYGYPSENVLTKKIMLGDTSDNIGNIRLLSEQSLSELIPEINERPVTVEEIRERAQQLIDERIAQKKKPYALHENIVKGISNKTYEGDFYEINRLIIDLHNPIITDDAKEMMDDLINLPLDTEDRSFKNVARLVEDFDLTELRGDTKFQSFFAPFKRVEEAEKKAEQKYKEAQK